MAQIENIPGHHSGSTASRKLIYMDLTPMVDLGFLLITFFMVSTILSQPKIKDLVLPKDSTVRTLLKESAVLTLMPVRKNEIEYFEGSKETTGNVKHCSYTEIRFVIQQKQKKVAQVLGNKNKTVIIIEPGDGASYKNFIDILDEIQINDVQQYFVVNHLP